MTVEPDRGVGHCPIYFESESLALIFRWDIKMFAVPAHAPPGQLAGIAPIFLLERTFYSPVVRQVQFAPCAVVEIGFCVRDVRSKIAFGLSSLLRFL